MSRVLLASLIGSAIEFYDFYIFGTAAVLVFPKVFFPSENPLNAMLASLATLGVAFVARPFGSLLFGHFGDKLGRKTTLVAALMTMGVSTVAVGLLPTHASIGTAAGVLLTACRFGQGLGLGGEWGGAVLLAVENAPVEKRAWYGMFPQLGAPIGFFFSGATFLAFSQWMSPESFLSYGWRIPFLASAVLVVLGLYVRLSLGETPVFRRALERQERVRMPVVVVFRQHAAGVVRGILLSLSGFILMYLLSVFALSWSTTKLGYSRQSFLLAQLVGVVFFGLAVPVSAFLSHRGRRATHFWVTVSIGAYGFAFEPLLTAGLAGATVALVLGFTLVGLFYGPLGTLLAEKFPTPVRYTGSSIAFNLAGIPSAAVAPSVATWLAKDYGLRFVGYYIVAMAALTLLGLVGAAETRDKTL